MSTRSRLSRAATSSTSSATSTSWESTLEPREQGVALPDDAGGAGREPGVAPVERLGVQAVADRDQPAPHRPTPGLDVVVNVLRPQEIEEGVRRRRHGGLPVLADPVPSTVNRSARRGKAWDPSVSSRGHPCRLNRPVTETARDTSYRLAPALGARLVGRSLVTLGVLVVVATVVGLLTGAGWVPAGVVTVVGLLVVARLGLVAAAPGRGAPPRPTRGTPYACCRAWASRPRRGRVVDEAVAASPGGERCLVLRLTDGRLTRLPMAALAADPDAVALDVRRRLRDAHTPDREPAPATRPDWVPGERCL